MKNTIPQQKTGGFSDTISKRTFDSEEHAKSYFQVIKQRFLDINHWHQVAGEEKAEFVLFNSEGSAVERMPIVGDFVRINIPGPENKTGDGFDWVKVEDIHQQTTEHKEIISIRVRPASSPQNIKSETAHFFDDTATSNFIIKRVNKKIGAEVHGRNEKPNVEDLNLKEKIRNTFIAIGGIFGASKIQWKSLTDGLIK